MNLPLLPQAGNPGRPVHVPWDMSGFSGGSFSFGHSHSRGHGRYGYRGHSHSSGHGAGFLGLGHSHSNGHRGHYGRGGHYRQVVHRRRGCGCLGMFLIGAALAGGSVTGLLSLLA